MAMTERRMFACRHRQESPISRILICCAAAGTLILWSIVPASAQVLNVERVRVQLAAESDIDLLKRRDFELARRSAVSSEALLERGFLLMRVFQLNGDLRTLQQSRAIFSRAQKKLPNDPRPVFGTALTWLHEPAARFAISTGTYEAGDLKSGTDPLSIAEVNLTQIVQMDSIFAPAIIESGKIHLASRDHQAMTVAAERLRRIGDIHRTLDGESTLASLEDALGVRVTMTGQSMRTANDHSVASAGSSPPELGRALAGR